MTLIRCEALRKSFGGVEALRGVSLQLPAVGLVAVIGPNGAGKTTLLNALTGFVRCDSGRIVMDGHDMTRKRPHQIARLGVARTFQELRVVGGLSVIENVMLGRRHLRGEQLWRTLLRIGVEREESANRGDAMQCLGRVGLDDQAERLAGELSYGQQKLLSLACCVHAEARVMLLDEPFAAVNPVLADQVISIMKSTRDKGGLVVFVEHDISAVRRTAEQVLVMDGGSVLAQGAPAEVLERPEILEAYVG